MEKEKVFIITIDEVYDFERFNHNPRAFKTEEGARKAFEDLKKEARENYKDELSDDTYWTVEEYTDSFEIYEDGRFAENHFTASLTSLFLED